MNFESKECAKGDVGRLRYKCLNSNHFPDKQTLPAGEKSGGEENSSGPLKKFSRDPAFFRPFGAQPVRSPLPLNKFVRNIFTKGYDRLRLNRQRPLHHLGFCAEPFLSLSRGDIKKNLVGPNFSATCEVNFESFAPMDSEKKYQTLNMCDFCSQEITACGAKPLFVKELVAMQKDLANPEAVVACDRYESPVEVLRRQFH